MLLRNFHLLKIITCDYSAVFFLWGSAHLTVALRSTPIKKKKRKLLHICNCVVFVTVSCLYLKMNGCKTVAAKSDSGKGVVRVMKTGFIYWFWFCPLSSLTTWQMSVHAAISLLLRYKPTVKLYQEKKLYRLWCSHYTVRGLYLQ